uniref:right-handed parallel beta-helix repeat-containing protein n=1 Tax=Methanobrevibacter sp. TaxID=66852 RepID=UPI00386D504B
MKKIEKISVLISIVLISLIAIGAVSAADDTASADDADTVAASEVQTIESDQTIDDISYESTDIIVTDTGDSSDSGDVDVAVVDNSSKKSNSLGSSKLAEGNTKTFTDLQTDLAGSTAILSSDYAYVAADGDTLKNGVVIDHDLTIIGGGHTISGSDLARIFYVNSGKTLTLMGLTLVNGAAENGAAIYNDGGSITIASSNINDNTATKSGGGIYNNGGSLTITSSEINGNDLTDRTVNGYGGAAIYDNGGTVLISGSTIANNLKDIVHRGGTGAYTGDLSSAAISTKNGKLTVTESVLENNSGSYGGAILADGANAELLVSGCTFNKNFAFNGGAIDISSGASYTITDSKFYNNDAKGTGSTNSNYANGGAICAADEDNQGIITGCEFENNTAAIGGAISSENTIVTECNFTNNTASASNSENFNGKVNNRGGFA